MAELKNKGPGSKKLGQGSRPRTEPVEVVKGQTESEKPGLAPVVEIFSDGACSGNPGPGGYGTILRCRGVEKELSGGAAETTNNRMELTAALEGLRQLTRPCRVTITTDSQYLVKGMTEWMSGWQRNGWKNSKKEPVLNRDLWEALLDAVKTHNVTWKWVRGHAGHAENERCDALARAAITDLKG